MKIKYELDHVKIGGVPDGDFLKVYRVETPYAKGKRARKVLGLFEVTLVELADEDIMTHHVTIYTVSGNKEYRFCRTFDSTAQAEAFCEGYFEREQDGA